MAKCDLCGGKLQTNLGNRKWIGAGEYTFCEECSNQIDRCLDGAVTAEEILTEKSSYFLASNLEKEHEKKKAQQLNNMQGAEEQQLAQQTQEIAGKENGALEVEIQKLNYLKLIYNRLSWLTFIGIVTIIGLAAAIIVGISVGASM